MWEAFVNSTPYDFLINNIIPGASPFIFLYVIFKINDFLLKNAKPSSPDTMQQLDWDRDIKYDEVAAPLFTDGDAETSGEDYEPVTAAETVSATLKDFESRIKLVQKQADDAVADYAQVMSSPETVLYSPLLLSMECQETAAGDNAIARIQEQLKSIAELMGMSTRRKRTMPYSETDYQALTEPVLRNISIWEAAKRNAEQVGIPVIDPRTRRRIESHMAIVLNEKATPKERELHCKKLLKQLRGTNLQLSYGLTHVTTDAIADTVDYLRIHNELPTTVNRLAIEK